MQVALGLGAGVLQTVVDYRGDLGVVLAVGLLFNHGGDGDNVVEGVLALLVELVHIVLHLGLEVHQHLVDDVLGVLTQIEGVGVGEEVALQTVVVAQGQVLEPAEVVVPVGGHILELLHRGDPLLLQQLEDLVDGVALLDGDVNGLTGGRGRAHVGHQGPVVHIGVQLVGARGDLVAGVGEQAIEVEEELVLNEAVVLEGIHHIAELLVVFHLDDGGGVLLVQGQQVVGPDPAHGGQHGGQTHHEQHIQQGAGRLGAVGFLPVAGDPWPSLGLLGGVGTLF